MKKVLILFLLIGGGFVVYKLTTLETDDSLADKKRGGSRWASAHINPSGNIDHKGHDHGDDNDKDKSADGTKAGKLGSSSKGAKASNSNSNNAKVDNPFLKNEKELENLTWEEAEAFAFREIDFKPQNEEEASLLEANRMMAASFMVPNSHTKLIEYYNSKGLKADVAKDSNPYTGTMLTVRTEKNLPGTRYAHTQYFTNEENVALMQHTSIEYRPGPDAFERTQEMVEKLYGVGKGKKSPNGRFINYKLGKGQILWIQKMEEKDLKGNPFNAYEPTDVGTIRMAIEQEIHNDEE